MKSINDFYPVVIVGASIAGCTAALLYAERGIKVLLIDKTDSIASYKKLCTHFVQPCGVHILRELGVFEDMDKLGQWSKANFWTSAGWVSSPKHTYSNEEYAINLERSKFDPYIKKRVDEHPLIDLILSANFKNVDYNKTSGQYKVTYNFDFKDVVVSTSLLVAADGRFSTVGKICDNETQIYPNDRFVYFAYYKNLPLSDSNYSNFWMLGENMAFIYPLLNDHSLVALYVQHSERVKWRNNLEPAFNEMVQSLVDGPDIEKAERITSIHGMNDITSIRRAPVHNGIAFIGDAALSMDPAAGTGCSFALLSASWLVEHSSPVLADHLELSKNLQLYADQFTDWMSPHITGITADSLVTKDINADKKFYTAVIEDEGLKEAFLDLTGRLITPKEFQKVFLKSYMRKRQQVSN